MKKAVAVLLCVALCAVAALCVGFGISQTLDVERLTFDDDRLPPMTIVHISDLHYPFSGVPTETILAETQKAKPDLIFLTGDIMHDGTTEKELNGLVYFLKELRVSAPCYAVLGNHEIGSSILSAYKKALAECDVILLENEKRKIFFKGKAFMLVGLSDGYAPSAAAPNKDGYPVLLLAHRPERLEEYASSDLAPTFVFSGHAHGGGARFFGRGLYAPDQGYFPRYTSGVYTVNNTTMIVSRGLGTKTGARFNNRYHLPVVRIGQGAYANR